METLNIGFIGLGYWGKNLLRAFSGIEEVNLYYGCDVEDKNLEVIRSLNRSCKITKNYRELLADPQVDAVVIATPSLTHYEVARASLEAGKATFVEKPLAMAVKEAEELIKISQAKKALLMVGHLLKHHPVTHYLKNMIDAGELGDLLYIYSQRLNLGIIRRDENPLWSLSTHDISLILYFFQQLPTTVQATGACYLQKELEDVVFAALHFPKGQIAHLHLSWLDPHKIRRLTIVGSKKMVVFDDMEPREKLRIYDKGAQKTYDLGSLMEYHMVREGDVHIPNIHVKEPLGLECKNFVQTIQGKATSKSDALEALEILKVITKLDESLKSQGKVISF